MNAAKEPDAHEPCAVQQQRNLELQFYICEPEPDTRIQVGDRRAPVIQPNFERFKVEKAHVFRRFFKR